MLFGLQVYEYAHMYVYIYIYIYMYVCMYVCVCVTTLTHLEKELEILRITGKQCKKSQVIMHVQYNFNIGESIKKSCVCIHIACLHWVTSMYI